jgi:hypothetical protein
MKQILFLFSLLICLDGYSQNCSDLFISEYVEGFSNNKAIEIYNPTNQPIDLSQYMIIRYANGANVANYSNAVQLSGIIQPYDVHVGVLEQLNPQGTGQDTPVDPILQSLADDFYCPDYNISNAFYFTGDDALMLAKGNLSSVNPGSNINTAIGFQIIDVFGKIGENPSGNGFNGWSTNFPYVQSGIDVTFNHSLIRKNSVLSGVTNIAIPFFNPLAEYDSIPPVITTNGITTGNWSTLGSHNCYCACMPSFDTVYISQCYSYLSPSGNYYDSSGVYTDTLTNSIGCDSLITTYFTYTPVLDSALINACQSFTINNTTFTNSGVYNIVIPGQCDTLLNLTLSIVNTNSQSVDLCAVGVNNNGLNRIVWEKPISTSIDYFNIYKETNQAGTYNLIGSRSYSDSSFFIDINSNPAIQAYRYKISSVDTCGIESDISLPHKTIHLTINAGIGQSYNLIWSHYEGFNFSTYSIYRGSSAGNLTLLTSIANTLNSYTDLNAPTGQVFYQIVAENPNGCNPTKNLGFSSSRSNFADTETMAVNEIENTFAIYPNPANHILTINLLNENLNMPFQISTIQGDILQTGILFNPTNTIDLELVDGIYFIRLGEKSIKFIVKN